MGVPEQNICNVYSEIFCSFVHFRVVPRSRLIIENNRFSLLCDPDDFTFLRVEGHQPLMLPCFKLSGDLFGGTGNHLDWIL